MLNFAIVKLASLLVLGKRGKMVKRRTEGQSHFPKSGGGALV